MQNIKITTNTNDMRKILLILIISCISAIFCISCSHPPKVGDLQLGESYDDTQTALLLMSNSTVKKIDDCTLEAIGNFRFFNTQWDKIRCTFDECGNLECVLMQKSLSSMFSGEVDFIREQLEKQFGGGFAREKEQIAIYNNDGKGKYYGSIGLLRDKDMCIVGVYKSSKQ